MTPKGWKYVLGLASATVAIAGLLGGWTLGNEHRISTLEANQTSTMRWQDKVDVKLDKLMLAQGIKP